MITKELFEALYYLNMSELKRVCHQLGLPDSPPKGKMIDRIKHFVKTGTIVQEQTIPEISKAKKERI